ncbi:MAG: hypothetical protein H7210_11505 [Pyrinomonadaceae bacterium]|nr:hypothetical protein [Phycisphaerales bacterium]
MKNLCAWAVLALSSAPALAQTNIDPVNKFSWSENCGWIDWRGANGGAQGVRIGSAFLSGYAWGENIGWINFGDGTPANGINYANINGTDSGVNIVAANELGGFAWAENKGWINFGPFATLPVAQHARLDIAARRLRGYAWGENIGWVNLDDAAHFVGLRCAADINGDGVATSQDFFDFLNAFFQNLPLADINHDGTITSQDFFDFITAFFAGC